MTPEDKILLAVVLVAAAFCLLRRARRRRIRDVTPDPFLNGAPFVWTCHFCGASRPDKRISVVSVRLKDLPAGYRNWRYCNDRRACTEAAHLKLKT